MANSLYGKGKEKIGTKQIDLLTDTIKVALVKSAYAVNLSTHEFLSDLGANVLGTNQALSGRSFTLGVFDAADSTWTAVAAGQTASYLVIFKDTGVAATSPLIAYIDTITNFPVTTNGGDIVVTWDNGTYRVFSL